MTGIIAPLYVTAAEAAGVPLVEDMTVASTDENAAYELRSSGDIYTTVDGVTADAGDWLDPQAGMSGFEVRATLVAGQVRGTSDALLTWLNLGTDRGWKPKLAGPTNTDPYCDLTIEIRPVGGVTVTSANIHVSAHFEE